MLQIIFFLYEMDSIQNAKKVQSYHFITFWKVFIIFSLNEYFLCETIPKKRTKFAKNINMLCLCFYDKLIRKNDRV